MADINNKNNTRIPVWISYARGEEGYDNGLYITKNISSDSNKDNVFQRVKNILQEEKINTETDEQLIAGDNLDEFERKFKDAKIVIVILSDKYLTSEHCMNEWKNIQQSIKSKKVFYIKYNEEIIKKKTGEVICKKGFDLGNNQYRTLLYSFWINFFEKNYDLPHKPTIIEKALQNCCYFDEISKIYTLVENYVTPRTGSKTFNQHLKSICEEIKKMQEPTSFYNGLLNSILTNETILVIGDSVLEFGDKCLGQVVDEELQRWLIEDKGKCCISLRDWNRNFYDEKIRIEEYGYKIIQEKSNACNNDKFLQLLNDGKFNTIISLGYSDKLYDTVENYARKNTNFPPTYIPLKGEQFAKPEHSNPIKFYDLVRDRIGEKNNTNKEETNHTFSKKENILFEEKTIVDFISACIIAIRKEISFANKSVLALGTNFPGWGVRFIWNALNYHSSVNPALSNRELDSKTYNYINCKFPNQHIIEENNVFQFMDDVHKIYTNEATDSSCIQIYVFFYEEDRNNGFAHDYYNSIKPLEKKYKVKFVKRQKTNNPEDNIVSIKKSDFVIIYKKEQHISQGNYINEACYAKEITAIKELETPKLFLIYHKIDEFHDITFEDDNKFDNSGAASLSYGVENFIQIITKSSVEEQK